jgi:dTDP-4-dehydrorhamnose 3,5-epimerase
MTTITPLALPDVLLITPKRHGDARGWFSETWNRATLAKAGLDYDFVQDNQAFSAARGTVRGLHFQRAPYGRWVGVTLTAEGGEQLLVPRGFAHGYCTTLPDTELAYKVDNAYAPDAEGGLLWNDPRLGIDWPVRDDEAVINARDASLPTLTELGRVDY